MKNLNQFNRYQLAFICGLLLCCFCFFALVGFSPDIPYLKNDSKAQWIIHPDKLNYLLVSSSKEFPVTTRFQKELDFIKGMEHPVLYIKAYKQAVLFINGIKITTTNPDNWKKETLIDLAEHLEAGINRIAIEVTAFPGRGILYAYISGLSYRWATDSSWYSETEESLPVRAIVADDTQSNFDNFSQETTFKYLSSLLHRLSLFFLFVQFFML